MKNIRGFTLIELMISISIGMLICAVAFSGFRVMAQSLSIANHLSIQNNLLRTGIVAANYELDFWDAYDSRSDPNQRPLRAKGLPFYEVDFTDDKYVLDFDQSHKRSWWNGVVYQKNDIYFGDYSTFGRQEFPPDDVIDQIDPAIRPAREWRHQIFPYICDNLGYYAAIDYLPANFVYGFYGPGGQTPKEFFEATRSGGGNLFQGGYGNAENAPWYIRGNRQRNQIPATGYWTKSRVIIYSGYLITPVQGQAHVHRNVFVSKGSAAWNKTYTDSHSNKSPAVPFLDMKPEHWPEVKVSALRSYSGNYRNAECRIELTDPLTGEKIIVTVMGGMATSLRGARRQRNLDREPVPTTPLTNLAIEVNGK